MDSQVMLRHIKQHGVTDEQIEMMKYCNVDLDAWLSGFENIEKAVRGSVHLVKHHPLVPKDLVVRGFIINSVTGELTEYKDLY